MKEENIFRLSPKDFFLNLSAVITLYVAVGGLLTLIFTVVDKMYPGLMNSSNARLLNNFSTYTQIIRSAIATLVVVVPLHLAFVWLIEMDIRSVPEKRNIMFRKWLQYFTLFLSVVIVIVGIISVVMQLLSWDFNLNFVLKIISIFIVTGGVFYNYFRDIISGGEHAVSLKRYIQVVVAISVIGIIVGFASLSFAKNPPRIQRPNPVINQQQVLNQQALMQNRPVVVPVQNQATSTQTVSTTTKSKTVAPTVKKTK